MLRKKCHDILKRALEADESGRTDCLNLYREARVVMKHALETDRSNDVTQAQKMRDLFEKVEDRIATITRKLERRERQQEDISSLQGVDPNLANSILDDILFFNKGENTVTFSHIIGQEEAKQVLKENIILPSIRPEFFTGLRSPVQGILLHGPPGNGKTLLAKAAAIESNYLLFNISASSIMSKWVGESEKLMRTLFVLARQLQPSIIFFDEVDSILSSRKEGEHDTSRRLKTEFLTQVDGAGSHKEDRILVMCATNRPQDIDEAVLRRLPLHIHVRNPSFQNRKKLLSSLLSDERHSLGSHDIANVARATEGYSACDLTHLARQAAMVVVRELGSDELSNVTCENLRPMNVADFLCLVEVKKFNNRNAKK